MSAGGYTSIQYGPVVITNVLTRTFSQEEVLDDSGTDLLYFKYTVRVVGYILDALPVVPATPGSPTFGITPITGANSPANQLAQLRYQFAPRQQFSMFTTHPDGTQYSMLRCGPANILGATDVNLKDVNNGPRCKVVAIDRIVGDATIRVELEFEICMLNCDYNGGTSNTSGVLSNRWSCTDDLNEDFMTTRTWGGRLRLSSSQVSPHSFRYLVVPQLQMGMRRDSMNFRATEDGLNLDYQIVDKEIAFSAPTPATNWSLRVTERRDLSQSPAWHTDVDVMLKGDRYVDKKKLIAIASAIADAKFGGGNVGANNYLVESITISDEYSSTENLIRLNATAMRLDNNGPAVKGMQSKWLGRPIDAADLAGVVNAYDSRISRDLRVGEKLEVQGAIPVVGAFVAYLQTPCSTQHAIATPLNTSGQQNDPGTVTLPTVTAVTVTDLPDDGSLNNYDPANFANAYTYWQLDSQYYTTQNRAHCPIASTAGLLGSSSSSSANTSVVINLAPPMTKRVIRVVAERIGIMPSLPAPTDTFSDENGIANVLLENNLVATCPPRSPDAKQVYRVTGEITYALLQAVTNASQLRLGYNAWENQQPVYKQVFPEMAGA